MLKITKKDSFTVPISFSIPGEAEEQKASVTFRYMTKSEWSAFLEEAKTLGDLDSLAKIITGWGDMVGEDGNEIPYTKENLAMLLDVIPSAAGDIFKGCGEALFNARIKN